jgi:hypothetical protein
MPRCQVKLHHTQLLSNTLQHNERQYNPSMHNFTLANVNGSYMFRLHKVAIIRLLLRVLEAQRGYHTLKHSLQCITLSSFQHTTAHSVNSRRV